MNCGNRTSVPTGKNSFWHTVPKRFEDGKTAEEIELPERERRFADFVRRRHISRPLSEMSPHVTLLNWMYGITDHIRATDEERKDMELAAIQRCISLENATWRNPLVG